MGALGAKLRTVGGGLVAFWCPGCDEAHNLRPRIEGAPSPSWEFNGDGDRPTFSPSVLVTCGHYVSSFKPGDSCWCTYNAEHPERPSHAQCGRCHSYVRNGEIQFLADSTHALAGQTVPLPDWPQGRY